MIKFAEHTQLRLVYITVKKQLEGYKKKIIRNYKFPVLIELEVYLRKKTLRVCLSRLYTVEYP